MYLLNIKKRSKPFLKGETAVNAAFLAFFFLKR